MRVISAILILIVVSCGALFGALNGERIPIDFYFARTALPAGVALLGALLSGWLLGRLVAWLGRTPKQVGSRLIRLGNAAPPTKQDGA